MTLLAQITQFNIATKNRRNAPSIVEVYYCTIVKPPTMKFLLSLALFALFASLAAQANAQADANCNGAGAEEYALVGTIKRAGAAGDCNQDDMDLIKEALDGAQECAGEKAGVTVHDFNGDAEETGEEGNFNIKDRRRLGFNVCCNCSGWVCIWYQCHLLLHPCRRRLGEEEEMKAAEPFKIDDSATRRVNTVASGASCEAKIMSEFRKCMKNIWDDYEDQFDDVCWADVKHGYFYFEVMKS